MKHKTTVYLSTLCIAAILTSILTACGDAPASPAVTTNAEKTSDAIKTTESIDPVETKFTAVANIPEDANYDGYTFHFLISGNGGGNDVRAEELTGDALNDALFERNRKVEARFGITIEDEEMYTGTNSGKSDAYKMLTQSIMANDNAFDAAIMGCYDLATLSYSGYLYDLAQMPYLDLTQPWWDQKVLSDLNFGGHIYFTTGDAMFTDNNLTCAMIFNKQLCNENDLDNPYELVKSGKWTMEKWGEMCKDISADLNGDGVMDDKDRYGALIWDDILMAIVNAAGGKCATLNADGQLELTLNENNVLRVFDTYTKYFYDKQAACAFQRYGYSVYDMFSNNQALFYAERLECVGGFRDMEGDFGILPIPKLTEEQEEYYSVLASWTGRLLCAPAVQDNAERTGQILEYFAAESMNIVTPAYYEKLLMGKYARDEDSAEMIDIILASHNFDPGWYFQIGGYNEGIMNLWREYSTDFASMFQKNLKRANKTIDKINTAFLELEEKEY